MEFIKTIIDIFLHLDVHLNAWSNSLGIWLYVVLFLIIFCETGLVVMPFLPGDSLLFAVGALSATGGAIQLHWVAILLCVAAILGDALNYSIGKWVGPTIFSKDKIKFLNKKHLIRTQQFYEKHGGKTIILARFAPIIRTFAPFVAGIAQMQYSRFAIFNVSGALLWVLSFLFAGNFFGNTEVVQRNFHLVILAIVIISLLPMVFEFLRARREKTADATQESA